MIAQEETVYFGNENIFEDSINETLSKSPLKDNNRLNVRFSSGMMYSNYYGNGLFTAYAAPELNYKLTNRFSVSGGFMMTSTTVPSIMMNESAYPDMMENKMFSYYMFAKGEYIVNDKLRVNATTAFDVSPGQTYNRLAFGSVGFDYKIGEDSFISAEFIIDNRPYNPMFHQTPFGAYDNSRIRPYGNSLFSDHFTEW
ncbi:MAG: hypothetical protein C0596_00335 [Marinilabiliales bacterium]|nr:MAG: hypothetical protein C0596_00335 [Marinilabiliales bacterium]